MSKGIFVHKPDSIYDDDPARHYHFPKTYLTRVEQTVGDLIIYYGPIDDLKGRYYWATAQVEAITQDPKNKDLFYARMSNYLDFDKPVHYSKTGGFERKLIGPTGLVNGGTAQQAVRLITDIEFAAIIEAGLSETAPWPDRLDSPNETIEHVYGFNDQAQMPIGERPVNQYLTNHKFRDEKFKTNIRRAYDRTCAFTGLRLINGKGRPEVEAAHIIPVSENGPDAIQNGIALSGTVHWMFDRGMLSIADDYTILVSRQLNYDVSHMLNTDMRAQVPSQKRLRPHPVYMSWHRENVFKN